MSSSPAEFLVILGAELASLQRFALLLTGDSHAAEDLLADAVALTLFRWRAGDVHDGAAYVRRVMTNLAARRWRRRRIGRDRDRHAIEWNAPAPDLEMQVVERDRAWAAVMSLPPRRRAVVVLRYYDDLSELRIAELLGIRVGTVKSQLSRALDQLRSALEDGDKP